MKPTRLAGSEPRRGDKPPGTVFTGFRFPAFPISLPLEVHLCNNLTRMGAPRVSSRARTDAAAPAGRMRLQLRQSHVRAATCCGSAMRGSSAL
ncbi:hypothetical protein MTO96_010050 [Rhipicephalus appendiculatus]